MKRLVSETATNNKSNNKGFTLVELLVVIGLLGVSIGVTNDILTSLVRSYSKTQVKNELEQQANFLGLKLEREIRSASDVYTSGTPPSLTIQKSDNTTITYSLNNEIMYITYPGPGGVQFPVTYKSGTGGVKVQCPSNVCFTVTGTNPKVVAITISMVPAIGENTVTFGGQADINTTVTVRNSYQ